MLDIKSKVLQNLMDKMDEMEVSKLKTKSPKFAKVDIASNDPSLADKLKDKLMGESENDSEGPMDKEMMGESMDQEHSEEDDLKRMMQLLEEKFK